MHELSLAFEVIDIAQREAAKNNVTAIREIHLEVGNLSGVEADAFQSALEMLVRNTLLENASIRMTKTPGKGKCIACNNEFDMKSRVETCPECHCFPSEIVGGEEFRIVSLLAE
jgi:hydrogenase nickel incorporation protein HypA/HybF